MHKWFLRMSERPAHPLTASRWVQSIWWVLIGSLNLDGFDSRGHSVGSLRDTVLFLSLKETAKDFFPTERRRAEWETKIIQESFAFNFYQNERRVFLRMITLRAAHRGSVFKVLWYDGGAQVCVERCIYLFSWCHACVRREEGGWLISDQIIRFAIRAAAAVRGSGRLKHGRRRH